MEEFIINALLSGTLISIVCGVMGCFVVWQRMSYFGDALSHAALLGIVCSLALNINPIIGAICIAIVFSVMLIALKKDYENDTVLGILSHSGIAISITSLSFMTDVRVDLIGYLFGDILTVTTQDIKIIISIVILQILWILINWRKMLIYSIDKHMAAAQNINVKMLNLQFTMLIAIIVVISIKVVGILLITALLIIPPSIAKNISFSPIQMVIISMLCGILSVYAGIYGSFMLNTPSGPSIIISSLVLFVASLLYKKLRTTLYRK